MPASSHLKSIFPYLRPYWRELGLGFVILVFNSLALSSIPWIYKLTFDGLRQDFSVHRLLLYCGLLILAVLVRGILQYQQRWILISTSRKVEYDLRNDLMRHLEQMPASFYQRLRTGDLMARCTNDLNAVRNMVGPGLMYSANAVVLFVVVLTILLHIDARLTLLVFLPTPFISLAVQWFGKRIHERFERIQSMFSSLATRVEESLSGLRVLRAYAREEAEIESFERLNRDYIRRNLRLVALSGAFNPMLQLLLGAAFVLVLWTGGRAVLAHQITLGSYVAFNMYMLQMSFPILALGWVINLVQRGTASMARIQEILATSPEIADGPRTDRSINTIQGDIEFRNVSVGYGDTEVLHNVSLHVPAGQCLAIVGATGAGKTTMISLLPRFIEPSAGELLIDGHPIASIPLQVLRSNLGIVPQETFLFSDTLHNNIAFGAPAATGEEVRNAASAASLGSDVSDFPKGFETLVGERGLTLSGGQKQRTALARALIRNPRILILDDALASVDTITEERILERLQELMRGRTTLLISHRVSTVRNADQIIVLEQGRIAERGTHSQLIGSGGLYASLYEKQLLEEELQSVE